MNKKKRHRKGMVSDPVRFRNPEAGTGRNHARTECNYWHYGTGLVYL